MLVLHNTVSIFYVKSLLSKSQSLVAKPPVFVSGGFDRGSVFPGSVKVGEDLQVSSESLLQWGIHLDFDTATVTS